jgi:Na+-transporting methylmalonyl-CoA/oxaloacetate decarboxylase gamma subunit
MAPGILLTLQITLIGMGLVFAALILLWGFMELLVRLTAVQPSKKEESLAAKTETLDAPDTTAADDRNRVALAAVALALAERDQEMREFPVPPTAIVSAWQAVNRSNMLNKRGQIR